MDPCPDLLYSFCKQVRTQQIHEMKKKEKGYIKLQAHYCIFFHILMCQTYHGDLIQTPKWCLLDEPISILQERINQVLMEKTKELSCSGMEIMNLLQVLCLWIFSILLVYSGTLFVNRGFCLMFLLFNLTERGTATWYVEWEKNDNDYYKIIVSTMPLLWYKPDWIYSEVPCMLNQVDAYEVNKQELMQENADLRALLRSMQVQDCEVSNFILGFCL